MRCITLTVINLFGPSGIGKTTLVNFLTLHDFRVIDTDWLGYRTKDDKFYVPYAGIARSFHGIPIITVGIADNWNHIDESIESAAHAGIGYQNSIFNFILFDDIDVIAHQGVKRDKSRSTLRSKTFLEYYTKALDFYSNALKLHLPFIRMKWITELVDEGYDIFYELTTMVIKVGQEEIKLDLKRHGDKINEG